MLRLLDTEHLVPEARAESIISSMSASSPRCRIVHLCSETAVWARFAYAQLPGSVEVLHFEGSALRMTRRQVDTAEAPERRVSFTVPGSAGGTLWQGSTRRLNSDDLVLIDLAEPFDYRFGEGARSAVQIDLRALGVTRSQISSAVPALARSPLYPLVRDHVRNLAWETSKSNETAPFDGNVAHATTNLLTALLQSCC